MIHRSMLCISVLDLLLCFSMTGCGGAGPLRIIKNPKYRVPWCGPNQRVQIGERVVGHNPNLGAIHREFLVDDAGKEYDPKKLADQVWSYLERTGDAKKIKEAFSKEAYYPKMTIVSINPVVVILEIHQVDAALRKKSQDDTASMKQIGTSAERSYWVANIYAMGDPVYQEGLQWFSPDLRQKPINLAFSKAGVAEISLANGKLKLIREGDDCKTTRE
jgi:hypothetical protein